MGGYVRAAYSFRYFQELIPYPSYDDLLTPYPPMLRNKKLLIKQKPPQLDIVAGGLLLRNEVPEGIFAHDFYVKS